MKLDLPHPILRLPTREEVLALERIVGKAAAARRIELMLRERFARMQKERTDPFRHGWESPIWHVVDQCLCDGNEVVLVDPAWDLGNPAEHGISEETRRRRLELRATVPKDFLREALRRRKNGQGRLTLAGALECWISGSNRSSKSEYCGKKIMKLLDRIAEGRTWCFADSEEVSIARQQPILFRYLPAEIRASLNDKGKAKSLTSRINWNGRNFVGNHFMLPNAAQNWFKNYKQNPADFEGDQLDGLWLDELRDPALLRTLRVRMGDRNGIILVSFTSIDDNYTAIVDEYEKGAKTVLEVEAELLPHKELVDGVPTIVGYDKVPRVRLAGPGSDGNQRAVIVNFHITDNPYYGFTWNAQAAEAGKRVLFGKERFYRLWRNATRQKILSRVYGMLPRARLQQFRYNPALHEVPLERVPRVGTRFHIVDPCPGRNWFMLWLLIDPQGRWFVYREWPSYGHNEPSAYVPGIGDPGPWAVPGGPRAGQAGARLAFDGSPGPAQSPFGFGLERYKEEIDRLEGRNQESRKAGKEEEEKERPNIFRRRRGLTGGRRVRLEQEPEQDEEEEIYERWMDSRYANTPTVAKEAASTNIKEAAKVGLEFRAAPSEQNILSKADGSIEKINDLLAWDDECEIGKFSSRLNRLNEPRLFVAETCPNTRFALKEWTGKDGQHGACKDPADCLRYAALCELDYVHPDDFKWRGGGSY